MTKRLMTLFVTVIVLGICFIIMYYMDEAEEDVKDTVEDTGGDDYKYEIKTSVSFAASLVIVMINGLLTVCIKKFAMSESRSTETHLNVSIGSKLALA